MAQRIVITGMGGTLYWRVDRIRINEKTPLYSNNYLEDVFHYPKAYPIL